GVRLDSPTDGLLDWSKSIDRIVDAVKSEAAHAVSLTIAEKGLRGRIRVTKEGRPNSPTPFETVQAKITRNFKPRDCSGRKPGARVGSYTFSGGLLCCGSCGRPMYGAKDPKGRVIYRCHRVEVDIASKCGYWIAYESDLMPFVHAHFLPDLRRLAAEV